MTFRLFPFSVELSILESFGFILVLFLPFLLLLFLFRFPSFHLPSFNSQSFSLLRLLTAGRCISTSLSFNFWLAVRYQGTLDCKGVDHLVAGYSQRVAFASSRLTFYPLSWSLLCSSPHLRSCSLSQSCESYDFASSFGIAFDNHKTCHARHKT